MTAPRLSPMLCQRGELPDPDDGWAFEVKWDGARALIAIDEHGLRVRARGGEDITGRYPELAPLPELLAGRHALLDAELVCLDDQGRPSFPLLQQRLGRHAPLAAVVERLPVTVMVFDLLWLDGDPIYPCPWSERRGALEATVLAEGPLRVPAARIGAGGALYQAVCEQQLEGVVCKRVDAPYLPGKRSSAWRKIKALTENVFTVCAVERGHGSRAGLGALHVARSAPDGSLSYAGAVGSGFSEADLRAFTALLGSLARPDSPVNGWHPPRGVICVQPQVKVKVRHFGMTANGLLREPVFRGVFHGA